MVERSPDCYGKRLQDSEGRPWVMRSCQTTPGEKGGLNGRRSVVCGGQVEVDRLFSALV